MKQKFLNIILLVIFSLPAFGQSTGGFSGLDNQMMQSELDDKLNANELIGKETLPVGNVVIPENYYLGPSDIISIQDLQMFSKEKLLEVTADNQLFLPRYGYVSVKGLTLADLSKKIEEIYKDRNANSNVNVGLKRSRMCLVTLKGNVTIPSVYPLPASYRVSTAISYANNKSIEKLPRDQVFTLLRYAEDKQDRAKMFANSGLASVSNYSRRNIMVMHKDGTSDLVDLERASALNDPTFDPYIKEGDIVYVPFQQDNSYEKIAIYGAVIRPVVLPFKKGDKLSHLLKFSYGPTDKVDLENIYVQYPSGEKQEIKTDENFNLQSEDIDLKPGMKVVVGKKKNNPIAKTGAVSIQGEVDSPGVYLIENNKTKLKDVIEMAGGFTDKAYLANAHILRAELKEETPTNPKREIQNYVKQSSIVAADTLRFLCRCKLQTSYCVC
jgi:protein involved in polysaccharide export with SLBB domain